MYICCYYQPINLIWIFNALIFFDRGHYLCGWSSLTSIHHRPVEHVFSEPLVVIMSSFFGFYFVLNKKINFWATKCPCHFSLESVSPSYHLRYNARWIIWHEQIIRIIFSLFVRNQPRHNSSCLSWQENKKRPWHELSVNLRKALRAMVAHVSSLFAFCSWKEGRRKKKSAKKWTLSIFGSCI